jgi:hypothetical protein
MTGPQECGNDDPEPISRSPGTIVFAGSELQKKKVRQK